ncbi:MULTISPECIES: hypothetical protein [Jonquetella]|nr:MULTISPECIES: hypothetical protein [Jonquetella]
MIAKIFLRQYSIAAGSSQGRKKLFRDERFDGAGLMGYNRSRDGKSPF